MKTPKSLMQGLYYPAVLGSAIAAILMRVGDHGFLSMLTLEFGYALMLVMYFTLTFVANERSVYNWKLFGLDCVEIAAAFAAFYFLGMFSSEQRGMFERQLYISLAVPPSLHLLWILVAYSHIQKPIRILVFTRFAVWIFSATIGYVWPWYKIAALIAFAMLNVWHISVKRADLMV